MEVATALAGSRMFRSRAGETFMVMKAGDDLAAFSADLSTLSDLRRSFVAVAVLLEGGIVELM